MTIRELISNSGVWVEQAFISFFKFWQDAFEKTSSLSFLDLTILQAIALLVVTPSLIYLYYYLARVNSLNARYWRASVKPYVSKTRYYSRLIFYPMIGVWVVNMLFMLSVVAYWIPLLGIFEYFNEMFLIGYVSIYIWWVTLSTKEPFPANYNEWKFLIGNDYHVQPSSLDKEIDSHLEKRTIPELSEDNYQLHLNSCARVYERRMYIYTDDENEENLKGIFGFHPSDDEETNKRKLEAMEKLRHKRITISKKALDDYKKKIFNS